jgi:hypothetical protein
MKNGADNGQAVNESAQTVLYAPEGLIASGDDETKPPEPQPEPKPETPEAPETPAPGDKPDEGEKPEAPEDGEAPDEGEAPETTEDTNAIEALDFGGKDFKNLTANVTIDGETKPVVIADLIKNYQIGEAGEKRLREADELKDRARQTLEAQNEQWKTNIEILPHVADLLAQEKVLDLHLQSLEMIRKEDPAEYAARFADINKAKGEIEQRKAQFGAQIVQRNEQIKAQQIAERKQVVDVEYGKLLAERPELTDKTRWAQWSKDLMGYATAQGFDEAEVRQVVNHKMLLILDKARRWDEAQANISTTRKKPVVAPKALKPGAASDRKPRPKDAAEILYG